MHSPVASDRRHLTRTVLALALLVPLLPSSLADGPPEIPAVTAAMRDQVDKQVISGAVTLVARPDGLAHLSAVGKADIEKDRPMRTDTIFWIASMTKPITSAAILALQDDGKLAVDDLVGKYVPELAEMKTRDAGSTSRRGYLLTHTSAWPRRRIRRHHQLEPLMASMPEGLPRARLSGSNQSGMNTPGGSSRSSRASRSRVPAKAVLRAAGHVRRSELAEARLDSALRPHRATATLPLTAGCSPTDYGRSPACSCARASWTAALPEGRDGQAHATLATAS